MPEPKDEIETYDSKHGTPGEDHKPLSEADAWGTSLNPVRETPLAGKNLKSVGG